MNKWQIVDEGPLSALTNMQRDTERLARLKHVPQATLNFYNWDGLSATYGHFVRPEKWLDLAAAEEMGLELARRPTGGGILFHTHDLAFSLTVPLKNPLHASDTLQCYQNVNQVVLEAIHQVIGEHPELLPTDPLPACEASRHFCMAKPTIYDVMLGNRKIGGAAQRRTSWGFLHQGSIALLPPTPDLLNLTPIPVAESMRQNGFYLTETANTLPALRRELRAALIERIQEVG